MHCDLIGKGGDRSPDLPLSRWTPCPPDHPHGGSLASSAHWRKVRGREGEGVEGEGVVKEKEWRVHCDLMGKGGDRSPDLPLSRYTPCPPDHPHRCTILCVLHRTLWF